MLRLGRRMIFAKPEFDHTRKRFVVCGNSDRGQHTVQSVGHLGPDGLMILYGYTRPGGSDADRAVIAALSDSFRFDEPEKPAPSPLDRVSGDRVGPIGRMAIVGAVIALLVAVLGALVLREKPGARRPRGGRSERERPSGFCGTKRHGPGVTRPVRVPWRLLLFLCARKAHGTAPRIQRASLVHVPNHSPERRQGQDDQDDTKEQATVTRRVAVRSRGLFFAHRFGPRGGCDSLCHQVRDVQERAASQQHQCHERDAGHDRPFGLIHPVSTRGK